MEKLIALIEKGKPFFNAIARNKYLKAIRDGFISVMPIIIVSSIFLLVSAVPNVWGFYWPAEINDVLMKAYNYSMGIVGICAAATTAKHFCDAQNRDLPKNNQINFISVMIASLIGFLLLSSDAISFTDNGVSISGLANGYMGSKGLLTAFICAFATGIIYKFFIKRNITIKMPEQVPPNISQTFKDIIPFGVCLVFFWGFDFAFRNIFGFCFAQGVIQVFQPLFSAADGYLGLAIIYGAMSLFWFVGVHGPSIVEPAISAALISNLELNMAMYQAGEHATAVLTKPLQDFVVAMGGTGATLVVCFMFAFLAKSKEMRAVGRASAVPVCFGVNEPFLFGAPMVLNPIFFIPFIFAPIANIWITKFFIDVLGMNGFMFSLPWTTPAPLGIAMVSGTSAPCVPAHPRPADCRFPRLFPLLQGIRPREVRRRGSRGPGGGRPARRPEAGCHERRIPGQGRHRKRRYRSRRPGRCKHGSREKACRRPVYGREFHEQRHPRCI